MMVVVVVVIVVVGVVVVVGRGDGRDPLCNTTQHQPPNTPAAPREVEGVIGVVV